MKKNLFFIFSMLLVFGTFVFSNGFVTAKPPVATRSVSTPKIDQAPTSIYHAEIPNTVEAKEIMKTIERAYDIQVQAGRSFDLTKFPTVFINDPRFNVRPSTLEAVQRMSHNPSLATAGYLDYKIAYYAKLKEAKLHSDTLHPEDKNAPENAQVKIRKDALEFISMSINKDIALVILNDGARTFEMYLVLVDRKWYIAGTGKLISVHP